MPTEKVKTLLRLSNTQWKLWIMKELTENYFHKAEFSFRVCLFLSLRHVTGKRQGWWGSWKNACSKTVVCLVKTISFLLQCLQVNKSLPHPFAKNRGLHKMKLSKQSLSHTRISLSEKNNTSCKLTSKHHKHLFLLLNSWLFKRKTYLSKVM